MAKKQLGVSDAKMREIQERALQVKKAIESVEVKYYKPETIKFVPKPGYVLVQLLDLKDNKKPQRTDLVDLDGNPIKQNQFMNDVYKEHPYQVLIIAVGEDVHNQVIFLKPYDICVIDIEALKRSPEILMRDQIYLLIGPGYILGVLSEKNAKELIKFKD